MNSPRIIELNNQRLLTTEQLAAFYEVPLTYIRQNYSNNRDKFIIDEHFIWLEGNALREFKDRVEDFDLVGKNARQLILWTKQGASRHSKMLNTKKAWEMFDTLEKNYFNKKEVTKEVSSTKALLLASLEHEEKIEKLTEDVGWLKETMRIDGVQEFAINQTGKNKVVEALGGKGSNAYKKMNRKVFSQFWNEFKKYFKIPRYGELPKKDYERAVLFIENWQPDTSTRMDIDELNNQVELDIA